MALTGVDSLSLAWRGLGYLGCSGLGWAGLGCVAIGMDYLELIVCPFHPIQSNTKCHAPAIVRRYDGVVSLSTRLLAMKTAKASNPGSA